VRALYAATAEPAELGQRSPKWFLPALFGIALVVYGDFAWRPVFWVDEYLTQAAIARPWSDLFHWIITRDPALGPYYIVMKIWSSVSISPFWMRLPSVVAMASAVVIVAVLVRRLVDMRIAYLAAGVMLLMPNISRFAQENRPYAFALLFTVAAAALWQWSLDKDRSPRWAVGYGAAVAGMGLAHLYTLTLIPALVAAALARPASQRKSAFGWTVVPAAIAVVVISPHIYLNLAHPTGSPTEGPLTVSSLMHLVRVTMPYELAAALAALSILGIVASARQPVYRPLLVLALAWTVIPPLLLLGAKITLDLSVIRVRYMLFVMPGLAMLVALGLRRIAAISAPLVVAALLVMTFLGFPRQIDIRSIDGHNRDQALAPLLRAAAQNGMPIVVANRQAVRLVNAATYPQNLLGEPVDPATKKYVAVVERTRFAHTVPDDFLYYQANGLWRQIAKCRVSQALVRIFENDKLLTGSLGSPEEVGKRLSDPTEGAVKCNVVDGLTRK
jgi:4-amino-4-deoxy-L-arabinose transferase-like glycosyltransferase